MNSNSFTDFIKSEHKIIKSDLKKLLVINIFLLIGVIALYKYDQKTDLLNNGFNMIF